ncbi:uncharacterized protein LOC108903441 [Anoplophora glabripennis]|uniref:uncharacterized protein LOC108903441 n=1 Tax=Anoplophora glabripennis TaxID=217634 RepID=UPI0008754625|nr:uncharacterized protein LOC108903441 [Anoplophora glabripennis]
MRVISSMMIPLCISTILFASTLAAPQFTAQRQFINEAPTPYEYQYKVDNPPTNTFFGKNEAGDAAGRVSGSYYVYLPDGRLMTVDYVVNGDSGFVPKIVLSNQATPYRGVFQG